LSRKTNLDILFTECEYIFSQQQVSIADVSSSNSFIILLDPEDMSTTKYIRFAQSKA